MAEFAESIRQGRAPAVTVYDGARATLGCLAMMASAREQAPVAIEPADVVMKVVQLGPYPPPHGGVQTNLVAIRDYLRRNGHACDAVNLTRFRRESSDGVYYPESASELMRLLWRLPADILHLHFGGDLTPRLLGLALFCTLIPGRKTVLTFHSGGYPGFARGPDGGARHAARLRDAPPGWRDRGEPGDRRAVRASSACAAQRIRTILPFAVQPPDRGLPLPERLASFLARAPAGAAHRRPAGAGIRSGACRSTPWPGFWSDIRGRAW